MKSYLELAPKYLSAHTRKTRLTVLSVIMAVTLVVGIFSMLDSLVRFERAQVLKDEGNYHIFIHRPSQREMSLIASRLDVQTTGNLKDLGMGALNGEKSAFGAIDESIAGNLNFQLIEGRYASAVDEVMLEQWVMHKFNPPLKIGDRVTLTLPDHSTEAFTISGIYNNLGATQAANIAIVLLSSNASTRFKAQSDDYFILFKDGVDVIAAEDDIRQSLNIPAERILRNERLLALSLQSRNSMALKIYAIGVVLFGLVLVSAVVMIYNTFNISVMERVRQFGLLRCVGASQAQIERLVRREGLAIALRAIPIGILAGMLLTLLCSAILKYYNARLFAAIPLFNVSAIGIGAGVAIGLLTVLTASLLPARRAARISPVNAVTGSNEIRISQRKKQGWLTRWLPAEVAIGVTNATHKKRTLFLMASSIAFSIVLLMGFSVIVDPTYLGMRPVKAYTADLSLKSEQGIDRTLYARLAELNDVGRVYGRSAVYVDATFAAERLSSRYIQAAGGVETGSNGRFIAPESSWLLSYDRTQLEWARTYLSAGDLDEDHLNTRNGIIAVAQKLRNGSLTETATLQLGDKVYLTSGGVTHEFTVMAILNSVPAMYESERPTLATFVTTEKLFAAITPDNAYKTIDIQLKNGYSEHTVDEIKRLAGTAIRFHDMRQLNGEARRSFLTVAVFLYGFVGVVALISILNIINTMNTHIAARTKYLGILRAVGMSAGQLAVMVMSEAAVYSLAGCITGCICGALLQKQLSDLLLAGWRFPLAQIVLIFIVCTCTALLSTLAPLKRVQSGSITEVIGSL